MALQPSNHRRRITLLVTTLAAVVSMVVGSAAAAHAAEVIKYKVSGPFVDGYTVDFEECTTISVRATEELVWYDTYPIEGCEGTEAQTYGMARPLVFDADGKATTAHVVAEIALIDALTGELTGEVVILDSTWTAVTRFTKIKSTSTFATPGVMRMTYRYAATTAEAEVSGPMTFDYAQIGKMKEGTMEVFHF